MSLSQKVITNVASLAGGRLLNSAMGVVGVGVAARYLQPDAYGALIAAIAFTSLVGAGTDLGTTTIGAREISKRPAETKQLLAAVFSVTALLSAATLVVAVALAFVLYPGQADQLEREAIFLLLLPTLLGPPSSTANTYFISEQKNYLGMLASVCGSVALLSLVFLSVQLDWGFTGVAAAYAANALVFYLGMILLALRQKLSLKPSLDRELCMQLLRWALPLGGSLLVTTIYWRLDVILLSLLSTGAEVGRYGLAFKVVDVLMILPGYMMLTLLPELARLSEHRDRLSELIQKAFYVIQTGVAPMFVFMVVFAPEVVRVVGGEDFSDAAPILQLLMVGVLIAYMGNVPAQGMVALNQQRSLLMIGLAAVALNLPLNFALIPLLGGQGAAVAYVITEAVIVWLVLARFRRVADVPRPQKLPQLVLAAGIMALAGLIKLLPIADDVPAVVVLAVGGAFSVSVYVAALYALKAMPDVIHNALVAPLIARLRPGAAR